MEKDVWGLPEKNEKKLGSVHDTSILNCNFKKKLEEKIEPNTYIT